MFCCFRGTAVEKDSVIYLWCWIPINVLAAAIAEAFTRYQIREGVPSVGFCRPNSIN